MEVDVMVVAPHPDDAEIAMGGTMAALAAAGKRVALIDLTDGEPTPFGSHEIRMQEAAAAASVLKVTERKTLDLVNREIYDTVENRKKVAAEMRRLKPKIVFAPYFEDGHPDHGQASSLVVSSRFYSKFVKSDMPFEPFYPGKVFFYFSTHIRVRFQPSFVFGLSKELFDLKMKALKCYRSQFEANAANRAALDVFEREGAYWGTQVYAPYGEPFVCREQIRLLSADSLLEA